SFYFHHSLSFQVSSAYEANAFTDKVDMSSSIFICCHLLKVVLHPLFIISLWLSIYYGCRSLSVIHYTILFLISHSIRLYRKSVNNSFCLRFILSFLYEEINLPFSVLLLIERFEPF